MSAPLAVLPFLLYGRYNTRVGYRRMCISFVPVTLQKAFIESFIYIHVSFI